MGIIDTKKVLENYIVENKLFHNRYKIIKKLGSGAAGTVYKAIDTKTLLENKNCAIKALNYQYVDDTTSGSKITKEIEKLGVLEYSKNVIKFLTADKCDGIFYIVMEIVEDSLDLNDRFTLISKQTEGAISSKIKINMTIEEFVYYFKQFANGMYQIHNEKIIHRDLKPANILINEKEEIKVSDFGVSELTNEIGSQITKNNVFSGTPKYASPEQILSFDNIDIRSDIYATGIIMYESITGVNLFDDYELVNNVKKISNNNAGKDIKEKKQKAITNFHTAKHALEIPVRPKKLYPWIPIEIDNIISKCLAKNPENRFQNFLELYKSLNQIKLTDHQDNKYEEIIFEMGNERFKRISSEKDNRKKSDLFIKKHFKKIILPSILIIGIMILLAILIISIT